MAFVESRSIVHYKEFIRVGASKFDARHYLRPCSLQPDRIKLSAFDMDIPSGRFQ